MFHTAEEFIDLYGWESDCTARVLSALTPESLPQAKADGHPSLGGIAWHIAAAPYYIMTQAGYDLPQTDHQAPPSLTPEMIAATHRDMADRVLEQSKAKTPEDLRQVFRVFQTLDWPLWQMMNALIAHEIHHRGQLSVLMRQAELTVPNIYGPNYEDTQAHMSKVENV